MVGGTIEPPPREERDTIVDGRGPDVYENEGHQVHHLVHREEHDVDVVGEALRPTVHGMERVAGERRGVLPLVVGLVQRLVPDHTATHVESGPALYHSSRDRPPTGWGGATSGAPSR